MHGTKIKSIRLSQDRTQEDVAKQTGLEQNEYSRIENDKVVKVPDATLEKIAKALGVTVADIKNPMPVIMSFNQSAGITQTSGFTSSLFEEMIHQLHSKDEQINRLLEIISPPQKNYSK